MQDPCYRCGRCGRQIVAHNLGEYNLVRHEAACERQQQKQKKKKAKAYLRSMRRASQKARSTGTGSVVIPGKGQLGFPFEGVEEEIE